MTLSFTCPGCRTESHNPTDVAQQYCGACHQFWTKHIAGVWSSTPGGEVHIHLEEVAQACGIPYTESNIAMLEGLVADIARRNGIPHTEAYDR